jgi:hypothetical protein
VATFAKRVWHRFLSVPERNRRWYSIILWWELRRIPYNFILLITGIAGLLLVYQFSRISGINVDSFFESGLPIIAFALGANTGYTLGWVVELAASNLIDKKEFGPRMFLRGTIFSLVLCILPALAIIIFSSIRKGISIWF